VFFIKTGMKRKIDELGRIVIPKEIRSSLKLNMGDSLEIYIEDNKISLKKYSALKGYEQELFNIAKIINELTNSTILFIEEDKVVVSYGKLSEIYIDQEINNSIYNKVGYNNYVKLKDIYLIDSYKEDRSMIITMLTNKKINIGLLVIIENEHPINQTSFEIINQFKKFILKQLES
jgi:AbrB family looped-hinge helix DNA binding protein